MPHLFNHWETEGSTDRWATSLLSFVLFVFVALSCIIFVYAQASLDTSHSFTQTLTPHWRGHSSLLSLPLSGKITRVGGSLPVISSD